MKAFVLAFSLSVPLVILAVLIHHLGAWGLLALPLLIWLAGRLMYENWPRRSRSDIQPR